LVWLKIATASAMWLRVSSWAATCFFSASRMSSTSVTSLQNTPTPPPSSDWAAIRNARRRPSILTQRTSFAGLARIGGLDGQGVGGAVESLAVARAAAEADVAPTARTKAALPQRAAPSAPEIQAGSTWLSMKAAKRVAEGRPASSDAETARRSQARAPAARPSTETEPFLPWASKVQASPRSNRPESLPA
jgi:hypothetical protein